MRITYLLTWGDNSGGTPRAILTQAKHLAALGDEVRVISVVRSRATPFTRIDPRVRMDYLVDATSDPVRPARDAGYDDPAVLRALAGAPSEIVRREDESAFTRMTDLEAEYHLRTLDTDVVVSTSPPLLAIAARFAPPGVTLVHQEHRASEVRSGQLGYLLSAGPRADAIVVLTERTRAWLLETLGAAAPRVEVVPGAIDDDEIRPRAGLDGKLIVAAGLLQRRKQFGHLIRAFGALRARHPDWSLRIYGEGPQRAALARLIVDLDLTNHVRLMGLSPVMAREWSKASIGALVSKDEAFPLVILEAFAAGVPFVSYDSPTGPAEIITHGRDGLIVPLGSRHGLIEALDRLMTDDAERQAMGEEAARSAERYRASTVFRDLHALYEDVHRDRTGNAPLAEALRRSAMNVGADLSLAEQRSEAASQEANEAAEAVRARHPELVLEGGRLWHPVRAITPREVRERNLAEVADVCDAAEIPTMLVRDRGGTRLAVDEADRARLLAALARALGEDAVYHAPVAGGATTATPSLIRLLPGDAGAAAAGTLGVGRLRISPERTLRFGMAECCRIEFWSRRDGRWIRPVPSERLEAPADDAIPDEAMTPVRIRVGERAYDSAAPFAATRADEVTFPIDVVYTWVDDTDAAWRERFQAALGRAPDGPGAPDRLGADASRYGNHDELRYSLRSLVMNAPWVNRIFLVTDQQIPSWLATRHPRLTVVDHKEIFSDGNLLPTFNSHAIGSQLHHIAGLSEHYLSMDDDVFFGRETAPDLFFHPSGIAKVFPSPNPIPLGPPEHGEQPHLSARKNVRALIERAYGRTIDHAYLHTPHPQRRSVLEEIERRFPDEIARTAASRFRHASDLVVSSNLHHQVATLTGRAVPGEIRYAYVDLARDDLGRLTKLLRARSYDVFCLSAPSETRARPDEERMLGNFLRSYFPFPSEFETDAGPDVIRLPERTGEQ